MAETGSRVVRRLIIRRNRYLDSVFLMQAARQIAGVTGIRDASALMATDANRAALADLGYAAGPLAAELAGAAPNDLVIALEGEEAAVQSVAADPDRWLSRARGGTGVDAGVSEPRSLQEAARLHPEAGVAVISVPGAHAVREARAALDRGLNVFLFSSNVGVSDELSLKRRAAEQGLIVMGPDCGTAFLCGAGLGFANRVRRGPIGVVGSTGTGMQEFTSIVHQAGSGISHALGTGSRDLSDAIGGISTMAAIDALERDAGTKVIAILSKPPGAQTAARLRERLKACAKPVVACLLGSEEAGKAQSVSTIDEAAGAALQAAGVSPPAALRWDPAAAKEPARAEASLMGPAQRYIRGVFAGGTFCYQAQLILGRAGLIPHSNSPFPGSRELVDPRQSRDHSLVDMGAEIFVEGRPHPMMDSTLRRERVEREGRDPEVAVLLLDFILGALSSRDPAGELLGAIAAARLAARERGDHLCVVASLCGTTEDAQGLAAQTRKLEDAGVRVFPISAHAAFFCREVALETAARRGRAS